MLKVKVSKFSTIELLIMIFLPFVNGFIIKKHVSVGQ